MDKNKALLKNVCQYEMLNPQHGKYKNGVVEFEFRGNDRYKFALNSLSFYIDGKHYFAPMLVASGISFASTWVFQEKGKIGKLARWQLEQISTLCEDVASCYELPVSVERLLNAMRPQTEIYDKLSNLGLDEKTKKELSKRLREGDVLIKRLNRARRIRLKLEQEKEMNQ